MILDGVASFHGTIVGDYVMFAQGEWELTISMHDNDYEIIENPIGFHSKLDSKDATKYIQTVLESFEE
jgi:hypothetical protein